MTAANDGRYGPMARGLPLGSDQLRRSPARASAWFLAALLGLHTAGLAWLTFSSSYFISDDWIHFMAAADGEFWPTVASPINVHLIPLHRATSFAFFNIFGANFIVGVLMLVIVHAVTLVYLYKTLELIRRTDLNLVLVLLYATSHYLVDLFMWWTSGLHRLPVLLCTVLSCHQYLKLRVEPRWWRWLSVSAPVVVAMGFYAKGALIPLALLFLELGLAPISTRRSQRLIGLAGLLALAGCYLALNLGMPGVPEIQPRSGLSTGAVIAALSASLGGVFGPLAAVTLRYGWANAAVWALVVGYGLWTRPRSLGIWLGGAAIGLVHFGMLAVSPRGAWLGEYVLLVPRYCADVMLIPILTLALCWGLAPARTLGRRSISEPWARRLTLIAACFYALLSFASAADVVDERFEDNRRVRSYVITLKRDVRSALQDGPLNIEHGRVPAYVVGRLAVSGPVAQYATFLRLLGIEANVGPRMDDSYRITRSGHLLRSQKRARPRKPGSPSPGDS